MAGKITYSFSLEVTPDVGPSLPLTVIDRIRSLTSDKFICQRQTIGTSEEALQLAEITTPVEFFVLNLDPTNYVDIKVATSGAIFARLRPDTQEDGTGGLAFISELGSGALAPFAIANTNPCDVLLFAKAT